MNLKNRNNFKKMYILIIIMFFLVSCISIGYAYLEVRLSIQGDVSVDVDKKRPSYPFDESTAQLDTGINFKLYSSSTNGRGLYVYEGTENTDYPIYYYRGAVTNNNVVFARFCWKIVRTTETGGTKILYNGAVGENNTCPTSTGKTTVVTTQYVLSYDKSSSGLKYGNSKIKPYLDDWYTQNIESDTNNKHYGKYLEDTIWCNDQFGYESSTTYTNYKFYGFGSRNPDFKYLSKPIIICPAKTDRYTTKNGDNPNGNKLLDYPIALLTGDEVQLAGFAWPNDNGNKLSKDSYLYNSQSYWLMSPVGMSSSTTTPGPVMSMVSSSGSLSYTQVYYEPGIRPAISLKSDTTYRTSGSGEAGSSTNPYIVEYK